MLDHARRLLGEVDVAVADVRATAAGLRGSVRIGVAETVTVEHVVRRRKRAEQLAPELDISIERAACSSMLDRLAHGHFDALVAHGPVHAAGLEFTPFATDGFVCLLSRGHRLADRDAIVLDDLRQQRPIYLEGAGPWPFNDYHDDAITYRTLDDLLIAVAAEEGVAMLPAGAVSARAVSSIRVVPVSDAQPVPVGLLTPAGSASPLVRLLVRFAPRLARWQVSNPRRDGSWSHRERVSRTAAPKGNPSAAGRRRVRERPDQLGRGVGRNRHTADIVVYAIN